MKYFKKNPLLFRYIWFYVQSVFLPVILVIVSLLYSSSILQQEVIHSNRASVELIRESLDTTFQEMEETLNLLGSNTNLSRYRLKNYHLEAIAALRDINNSRNYLSTIIIYARGSDYFHASSGRLDRNALGSFAPLSDFSQSNWGEWVDMMQTVTSPVYWSNISNGDAEYLYLISPIHYVLQTEHSPATRSVSLVIRQNYIMNLFRSSQTTSDESVLLLGPDYTPLSKLTTEATDGYVTKIAEHIKNDPQIFENGYAEMSDEDMLMFVSRSEETGMTYVRFLPKSVAYRALDSQQLVVAISLVLTLVIGIILVVVNTYRSYTPIRSLADWIRERQSDEGINDELVLFQSALNDAFEQNAALSQVVDTSRRSLIDQLLTDLLYGKFRTRDDFINACQKLNVKLDKPYYAVCSLLVDEGLSNADPVSFDKIHNTICADLPGCYQLYSKNLLFAGRMILVISSDNHDIGFYQATMSQIKNRLLEKEQLMVSIGMGFFYESFESVGKSYTDSVNALNYRLVYGRNCLITPDICGSSSPELSENYPTYDLVLLDTSLTSRNTEMALTVLRRINATIKLKNYNLQIAQNICYDIFSVLKNNVEFTGVTRINNLPQIPDALYPSNYNTVDDFFSALIELILERFGTPSKPEPLSQSNIGEELAEYMDKHCLSYDFQIKAMAEHFSVSPQYMRKLFKSYSGVSISEYIANKRLEKAMHLLSETDMSMQEIVSEIGNSDISGFVRFFKQKTGLTPAQYRKNLDKQEE